MTPQEKEHLWQEYITLLPDLIQAQGLCNVVGGLANYVQEVAREKYELEDECAHEWEAAGDLLEDVTHDVDMVYK